MVPWSRLRRSQHRNQSRMIHLRPEYRVHLYYVSAAVASKWSGSHSAARTWACVGIDNSNAFLACAVLEETLFGAIVSRAGQAREIEEHWNLSGVCLRWEVQVELHLAVRGRSLVSKLQELAAKRGDCRGGFERHGEQYNRELDVCTK